MKPTQRLGIALLGLVLPVAMSCAGPRRATARPAEPATPAAPAAPAAPHAVAAPHAPTAATPPASCPVIEPGTGRPEIRYYEIAEA